MSMDDHKLEEIIAEINAMDKDMLDEVITDEELDEIIKEAQLKAADIDPEEEYKKDRTKLEVYDWLQCLVGAIIIGIFIFIFIGRTIGVDGISMMNTLHNGDRVVMSNLFYTPKPGDIIVFQTGYDNFDGSPLVKRVIAIEGQTVEINFECGHVFVDGVLQCEPFIKEPTHAKGQFEGFETVRSGHVFLMGDNRNHSSDSRDSRIGQVDTRMILGEVLFILIPGNDIHGNRDWDRFGLLKSPVICPSNVDCSCFAALRTCDC